MRRGAPLTGVCAVTRSEHWGRGGHLPSEAVHGPHSPGSYARPGGQGSADRRQATAANLEGKGIDAETVATRMRADVSQGRPATEAVAGTAGKRAPKARANRFRSAQAQRGDVSR